MEVLKRVGETFVLEGEGGAVVAGIAFHRSPENAIIIDHTEVSDSLKGQGVGARLVEAVVVLARMEKVGIIPACPYARKVLARGDGYADVLMGK